MSPLIYEKKDLPMTLTLTIGILVASQQIAAKEPRKIHDYGRTFSGSLQPPALYP
jgi:hypothetical protein